MEATDLKPTPAAPSLRDEIRQTLRSAMDNPGDRSFTLDRQADAMVQLLHDHGHIVPGAPPAARILDDARSFAERLTLTMLALRLLNMLAFSNVMTPESKGARRWLDDYLEGKNHGPAGKPMLWPSQLPGIADLLRQWGFQPTIAAPGAHAYVTRVLPHVTVQ
jgi:hypothetical protein